MIGRRGRERRWRKGLQPSPARDGESRGGGGRGEKKEAGPAAHPRGTASSKADDDDDDDDDGRGRGELGRCAVRRGYIRAGRGRGPAAILCFECHCPKEVQGLFFMQTRSTATCIALPNGGADHERECGERTTRTRTETRRTSRTRKTSRREGTAECSRLLLH